MDRLAAARRPSVRCSDCESEYIHYVGEGTERLEVDLKEHFPDARIGRIDRDTMRHLRDYGRVSGAFRQGELDIWVGTQMTAKGRDFPQVTLVGVAGANAALSQPDFRAATTCFERLQAHLEEQKIEKDAEKRTGFCPSSAGFHVS